MDKSAIKPIMFGILFGALAYAAPFFLFFMIALGAIFRMFAWRRFGHNVGHQLAYADIIRNMSNEDYENFKSKINHPCSEKAKSPLNINE